MKKSKLDIINKLLCLLLIISTIVGVIILPEKVPIHFNANSDITNYGSKCINIIMGALLLSIILGLNIYTNALNKKISENPFEKNKKNTNPYEYVNLSIVVLCQYLGHKKSNFFMLYF